MTSETIDARGGAPSEVAETIAPTWERRRAEIEEVSTPVREWMLHLLRPREGDTVPELGAGSLDTGFDARAIESAGNVEYRASPGARCEVGAVASERKSTWGSASTTEGFKSSRTAAPAELFDVAAKRDQAEGGERDADR